MSEQSLCRSEQLLRRSEQLLQKSVAELGEVKRETERPRPKPRAVAASNEASMNMLQGMLAAVPNAPTKKKPRKTK